MKVKDFEFEALFLSVIMNILMIFRPVKENA